MEVIQTEDGKWAVTDADGNVLAACETNAAAWKAYDRLACEPVSAAEKRSDWFVEKIINSWP
jgi:hypothetical protein